MSSPIMKAYFASSMFRNAPKFKVAPHELHGEVSDRSSVNSISVTFLDGSLGDISVFSDCKNLTQLGMTGCKNVGGAFLERAVSTVTNSGNVLCRRYSGLRKN